MHCPRPAQAPRLRAPRAQRPPAARPAPCRAPAPSCRSPARARACQRPCACRSPARPARVPLARASARLQRACPCHAREPSALPHAPAPQHARLCPSAPVRACCLAQRLVFATIPHNTVSQYKSCSSYFPNSCTNFFFVFHYN